MDSALLQSLAIVVVILLVLAFVWWHFTGWTAFTFRTGDAPSWEPTNVGKNISRLRFKNCVFSVLRTGDKAPTTRDVTSVLNSMAAAYSSGNMYITPPSLVLDRPLNAFSFVIPGFNDATYTDSTGVARGTVPDPSAAPWCGAGGPKPVACSTNGDCAGLPISAACVAALGADLGRSCGDDTDCGGSAGSCQNGICGPPNACTGVPSITNQQAGQPCATDFDCDSIMGSCQNGRCADTPARPGICRNCRTDADCGGVAGSCVGYSSGPDPETQPCAEFLGTCSRCPGAAEVTLTGFVRAI